MNPKHTICSLFSDTHVSRRAVSCKQVKCEYRDIPISHHHHRHYPSHQLGYRAAMKLLHPLSVTGQPLDGAPAVVLVLHFRFHSSSPGCLWSTTLLLSLWGPVDFNFGDGVGILAQHMHNPAPSLPGYGGLHILLLAPCSEVTAGDGSWPADELDFPDACFVKGRQLGRVMLGHPPAL